MRDLDRLIVRFRQFGGIRLVWEYAKMGVLWVGVKEVVRCAIKGRSFKCVYPVVTKRVDEKLINKYGNARKGDLKDLSEVAPAGSSKGLGSIKRVSEANDNGNGNFEPVQRLNSLNPEASAEESNQCEAQLELPPNGVVWFCWLQGIEKAPELVKTCLRSLRENVDAEIMVLDDRNFVEYVELPEFIVRKYRKGIIPPALFSDMLRLELLIRYGGTWMDSTVWVSPKVGVKDSKCWQAWQKIRESDLFIYRYFNREGRVEGMSNWFIHAKAGNALLKDTRDTLYAYWRDYDCTVEYYIFHLFFSYAAKKYPEMIRQMPKGNSYHALWLAHNVERGIPEADWQKLIANVPFHKLNWRKKMPKEITGLKGSSIEFNRVQRGVQ